jgi:hypothetical protein
VGKTESVNLEDRISKYQTAGTAAYSGRKLAIDVLEVTPPPGSTTEAAIEKPSRAAIASDAHAEANAGTTMSSVLRWDNTKQARPVCQRVRCATPVSTGKANYRKVKP